MLEGIGKVVLPKHISNNGHVIRKIIQVVLIMIGKVVLPKNLLILLWIRCIMNFLNWKDETSMALVAEKLSLVTVRGDDDWETVGPNNQVAITRTQGFVELELSAIFGGKLRSVVKSKDNKVSTTIEPFLLLPLEFLPEVVHTI